MLRIDRQQRSLTRLRQNTIHESALKERSDIQRMILNSPEAFIAEIGEPLLLLGEEIRPADAVDDRIDLLAVDEEGAVVVIELKRGTHKLHLLQSLSYAATIAEWTTAELLAERCRLLGKPMAEVQEEIEEFLGEGSAALNSRQRIMLLAEDFDFMVLATAEWLTEKHGVDIRCYRLALCQDDQTEYLTCTCIFPPPEIAQQAVRRGQRAAGAGTQPLKWKDWNEAISQIENPAMAAFYRAELANNVNGYLPKRQLIYRAGDKTRIWIAARKKHAYGWQLGRFAGDVDFWQSRMNERDSVQPVKDGRALRLNLSTENDFRKFGEAIRGAFQTVTWLPDDSANDIDDEEQ